MAAGTRMPSGARWAVGAAGLLVATLSQAQSNACETLKATLAARIESTGVRGYAMEVVPGRAPLPSGAKVIGNCDGGAFKVVYWRWASARKATPVVEEVKAPAPAPALAVTSVVPPPLAAPAPAHAPAPEPVVVPKEPVAAAPMVPIAASTATVSTPVITPPVVSTTTASADSSRTIDDRAAIPTSPEPTQAQGSDAQPFTRQATAFVNSHWQWMTALLLVPLALWFWAWRAHRKAYDEAGLPRGPKL